MKPEKYYALKADVEAHDTCKDDCDMSIGFFNEVALMNNLDVDQPCEVIEFTRGKAYSVTLRCNIDKKQIIEKVSKTQKNK